jgi:hypothetical protein
VIEMVISLTLQTINKAFSGISEVSKICGKIADINEQLGSAKSALIDLDSEYHIQQMYERHPLFVKPETVSVGTRSEILSDGRTEILECTAEYVPITNTVESLFKSPAFVQFFFANYHVPYTSLTYTGYQDGQRYRENLLPAIKAISSNPENIVLLPQFFYDGKGVNNPLRAQASLHNYAMFYFLCVCEFTHILLCFSKKHSPGSHLQHFRFLKNYGFNVILCQMLPD